jgi:hypothetical protein
VLLAAPTGNRMALGNVIHYEDKAFSKEPQVLVDWLKG